MSLKRAFTLTELMISVVIIGTVLFAIVEAYSSIQKAVQYSKDRTIATNLAHEKINIIREKLYYKAVPSLNVSYLTDFDPPIPYDTVFFPPETVLEGGVYYTRYTYIVPVEEVNGSIVELPPQSPDTGMKKISVTVVWSYRNEKKKVSVSTIYASKDTVMRNASIGGRIRDKDTLAPISNANIIIAEYIGIVDVSDSNGNYSASIYPGNYTLYVQKRGYFPYLTQFSVGPNQSITKDIDLKAMGWGKITGVPWLRDHLVISQIVGSTESPSGFDQEYIEIFNPTTYTWTVKGNIGLRFQRIYDDTKKNILINYFTDTISPGGFYLFANTSPVIINGVSINADAVWSSTNSSIDFPYFNPSLGQYNIIPVFGDGSDEGGGAIELYRISDGKILDQVGWNRNSGTKKVAPFCEPGTNCQTQAIQQNIGLQEGEQYVRYSSTAGVSSVYGPSYDSNNNSIDFKDYLSINISPRNSSNLLPIISGTPADGSIVGCGDGYSVSTNSYLVGSPPYSYFELNYVATGTWNFSVSSNTYAFITDSITVTNGSTVTLNSVYLTSEVSWGYITGNLTDVYGNNITPAIKVLSSDGNETYVSNKKYTLMVSTGVVSITANPGNLNPSYVSVSSNNISINAGEIKSGVNFVLFQGARITGKVVIAGSTVAVPGIPVLITDIYETPRDNQITDTSGRFITNVLSTGSYIVIPQTDSKESVNPSTYTLTLTSPGTTVFSTTFSITNAIGYIAGSVKFQNQPIKTGVLIVVSTVSLSGTPPQPPDISSQMLSGPPYYMASSNEEGNYLVEVRGSTNPAYNVYSYYPYLDNNGNFVIYWSSRTNIKVYAGQVVSNINFSW
jgi:prepilin-type N-terminal cleavage/methylation domain-containing protein